ncbi:MAG: hypothetical protein AAGF97_09170, partial [Planctomycetota bacterium]
MPLARLLASLLCLVFAQRAFTEDWMLQVEHRQRPIVGRPLQWDNQSFLMLARDGQIMELDLGLARQGKTLRQPFHSYSASEMRAQLMREFGSAFEVQGTGHYLVVHPAGQPEWPARFEALYREFTHYFGARGISVTRPPFPLVAVVFPTHESFLRYAVRSDFENIDEKMREYAAFWRANIGDLDIPFGFGNVAMLADIDAGSVPDFVPLVFSDSLVVGECDGVSYAGVYFLPPALYVDVAVCRNDGTTPVEIEDFIGAAD